MTDIRAEHETVPILQESIEMLAPASLKSARWQYGLTHTNFEISYAVRMSHSNVELRLFALGLQVEFRLPRSCRVPMEFSINAM